MDLIGDKGDLKKHDCIKKDNKVINLGAQIENNRSHGRIVYTLYWRSALTVFSPSGAYFLIVHVQIKNNRSYGRIVSTLYESACKKLSPKKKGSIKKTKKKQTKQNRRRVKRKMDKTKVPL